MNLQDEATYVMWSIRDLHDYVMFYIIIILIFIGYFLIVNILQKGINIKSKDLNHSSILEFIWTIIPSIILILIAIPTFKLLYSIDEISKPLITLKIQGNQWYWSYIIYDTLGLSIEFTSYPKLDLNIGDIRLLDVDNYIMLPINIPIRILVTSNDVIHAWTIPSLGIKLDAIPGRINSGIFSIIRKGIFYGQCSELCGIGHSYMPIALKSLSINDFNLYLYSNN